VATIPVHLWGLEKVMGISPAACHFRNLTSKFMGCIRRYNLPVTPEFMGCIRRYNLPVTRRLSNNILSGKAPIRENSAAEPEGGSPTGGELDWFPKIRNRRLRKLYC
jgi:hypothetical protein